MDDIDLTADYLTHISQFELPTGVKICKVVAEDLTVRGWVIDLGAYQYRYRDGHVGPSPRHRALEELGYERGEDDLHTEADWQAYTERSKQLDGELYMSLDTAWQVAQTHGDGNRHAIRGETVRLRGDGSPATIIDPGTDHDRGHYVRVADESGQARTMRLRDLILD